MPCQSSISQVNCAVCPWYKRWSRLGSKSRLFSAGCLYENYMQGKTCLAYWLKDMFSEYTTSLYTNKSSILIYKRESFSGFLLNSSIGRQNEKKGSFLGVSIEISITLFNNMSYFDLIVSWLTNSKKLRSFLA